MQSLKKWAKVLEGLTIFGMVGIPLAVLWALVTIPLTPNTLSLNLDGIAVSPAATPTQLLCAVALNLIPLVILLLTLNAMRRLFAAYRQGGVFTEYSARLIQRIGQGFLMLALTPLVLRPILSVILSLANPPGERSISILINSDMFFFATAGGLIIVIGWAMREASDLATENRAFV